MSHRSETRRRAASRALLAALIATCTLSSAFAADPWVDLGNGLAGGAGAPVFAAEGSLIGGTPYSLSLTGAAPNRPAYLIVGMAQVNVPFAGGVIVPSADVLLGPVNTGPSGSLQADLTWDVGVPAGLVHYWQLWIQDPSGPQGWSATNALQSTTPTQEGGVFPADWIHGGDCGGDPLIQVHRYNEDTFILRQSMCTDFEGPFMYLLFGDDTVLLEDTGAGGIPIADTVYEIIDMWLVEQGKTSIELVVAHSHAHGDHTQGDSQFIGQPNTTVVDTSQSAVASFFGIAPWPSEIETYDLGGRVLDVLAIPGHHSAHIAFYDRNTGLLLTGDSLYPGFIFLSGATWNTYRASISRLRDFVEDKPVSWVLGTHIEMKAIPFEAYPYGTDNQPNERDLQLEKKHLQELDDALDLLPSATTEVHADFIING